MQGEDNKKGKKKKSADLVELPFDCELPGNSEADLQKYREEEVCYVYLHEIFLYVRFKNEKTLMESNLFRSLGKYDWK